MRATRKFWIVTGALLVVYLVSYALNSCLGGYWTRPEMDGRDRYSFGLSIPDAVLWQPRWGHSSLGQTDFLGHFYAPMIWLEREYLHPTLYLSDDGGFEQVNRLLPSQVHQALRAATFKEHAMSQPSAARNAVPPHR